MINAIPVMHEPERYEICKFLDSEFMEITSDELFDVKMQYPLLHMKNAEEKCYVRKEVYHMLAAACNLLPNGYKLRIFDAWRPFLLQEELYEVYSGNIIKIFGLEESAEEERRAMIQRFVSEPIGNRDIPPVHTTGGAVDVTLIDAYGKELEMGTGFDDFTDRTYTAFYEGRKEQVIIDNRRLLYGVMTKAGFTNLPSEWWHYDYGDRFWGYYNKKPTLYKGVFTKEEMHGEIGQGSRRKE